jgi:predicted nucleic acid-binding protein
MRSIFVDSAHFVALLNHHDQLHERALRVALDLYAQSEVTFVTIDIILTEVLAYQSGRGARIRAAAVDFVGRVRDDPRIELIAQTPSLFDAGVAVYGRRLDKSYSLVDCMSMVVCKSRKIREVLTADRDFEQEGFTILL